MGEGYRLDMKTASGWDENETTGPVVGSGVLFKAKGAVFIM